MSTTLLQKGLDILEAEKARKAEKANKPQGSCPCMICGRGHQNPGAFCYHHQREIDEEERKRKAKPLAFRYVAYKGHVIGFFQNGGDTLKPSYIGMSTAKIPKKLLIDLDTYVPGFDRAQVKKLKTCILRMAKI